MKKTLKWIGITFGAFFAVVFILLVVDISNDSSTEKVSFNELDLEGKVKYAFEKGFDNNKGDLDTVQSLSIDDDKRVTVTVIGDPGLGPTIMYGDVGESLKFLKDEGIKYIDVTLKEESKGKDKGKVATLSFSGDILNKIDYEELNYVNIYDVADNITEYEQKPLLNE